MRSNLIGYRWFRYELGLFCLPYVTTFVSYSKSCDPLKEPNVLVSLKNYKVTAEVCGKLTWEFFQHLLAKVNVYQFYVLIKMDIAKRMCKCLFLLLFVGAEMVLWHRISLLLLLLCSSLGKLFFFQL